MRQHVFPKKYLPIDLSYMEHHHPELSMEQCHQVATVRMVDYRKTTLLLNRG